MADYTNIADKYSGYTVVDPSGSKIGKVDDLFVDETDQPEYFGVKMGFLGTKSTLIPVDVTTVDDSRGFIEVSQSKDNVKNAPAFDDDSDLTPEFENEVRSFYGLAPLQTSGSYSDYSGSSTSGDAGVVGPGIREGDTESGQFVGHSEDNEGVRQQQGSDLDDRDELRVQRSEEELVAGTREREAGAMRVRKRVRTDRERIEVPTRREEVSVERVPVNEATPGAQIGEDEVVVPVTEEEVVVDKRAVVKEEVRIRKDMVEDTQVVEEDVRKEEVDIVDDTERGPGTTGR